MSDRPASSQTDEGLRSRNNDHRMKGVDDAAEPSDCEVDACGQKSGRFAEMANRCVSGPSVSTKKTFRLSMAERRCVEKSQESGQ